MLSLWKGLPNRDLKLFIDRAESSFPKDTESVILEENPHAQVLPSENFSPNPHFSGDLLGEPESESLG